MVTRKHVYKRVPDNEDQDMSIRTRLGQWKNDAHDFISISPMMIQQVSQRVREFMIVHMMNILFIAHLVISGSAAGYVGLKVIAFIWLHKVIITWYTFVLILALYSLSSHTTMMKMSLPRAESQESSSTQQQIIGDSSSPS